MMPVWLRYPCMAFGALNVVQALRYSGEHELFMAIGGVLVGGGWFAFGWYGGMPLVSTVSDWRPRTAPGEITEMHREGLRAIRRRLWMSWAAIPIAFALMALLVPVLAPRGQAGLIVLIAGVPLFFVQARYYLSRCPRCGYGFFARSVRRAAFLKGTSACWHCGLARDADKVR